jgi:hypothetical protein
MFTLSTPIAGSRVGKMLLCAILLVIVYIFFSLHKDLPAENALKGEQSSAD